MAERNKMSAFARSMIALAFLVAIAAGFYIASGYWIEENAIERAVYDQDLVTRRRRYRDDLGSVKVLEKCGSERLPEPRLDDMGAIQRRRQCVEDLIGRDPRDSTDAIDRLEAAAVDLHAARGGATTALVLLSALFALSLLGRWVWNARARA